MPDIPVNNNPPRVATTATAGQTVFSYTFRIDDSAQLQVERLPVGATIPIPLVEATDYTVAGVGAANGGTITLTAGSFPSGATVGEQFTRFRKIPIERQSDFPFRGRFAAQTINQELDNLTLILQELDRDLARAFTLPSSDSLTSIELPLDRANKALHFDSGRNPIAVEPTDGSGTIVTATGTTTGRALAERAAETLNPRDNGATGDGVTDDQPDIATTDLAAALAGKAVRHSAGVYVIASNLTYTADAIFEPGARLKISTGVTVTFTKSVSAGSHRIFELVGTGKADFATAINLVRDATWWGTDNGGLVDTTVAGQAAIDAGKGQIWFVPGTYLVNGLELKAHTYIVGQSDQSYSNNPGDSPTVFLRAGAAAEAIKIDVQDCGLYNLEVDGNGGQVAVSGDCVSTTNGSRVTIAGCKFIDGDHGIFGNSPNSGNEFQVSRSTFKFNNIGVKNLADSSFVQVHFGSNQVNGMSMINSAVRLENCFFDFNGGVAALALNAGTSNVIVMGCIFDRNEGNDIRLVDGGTPANGPKRIHMIGNLFSRSAWNASFTDGQRYAIRVGGGAFDVVCSNNTFEGVDLPSNSIDELYAPIGAADFGLTEGLSVFGNTARQTKQRLDLNTNNRTWTLTGNEYYVLDPDNPASNPALGQPDFVEHDGTILTVGTLGALAVGEWAYGDPATLGFSTTVVRLTGDVNPTGEVMLAFWDHPLFKLDLATDVQTETFRDQAIATVGATSSVMVTLKTRERVALASRLGLKIGVFGDDAASNEAYAEFPIVLKRTTGGAVSVIQGTIINSKYVQAFATGWNGDATALELDVTAGTIGTEIDVTLENTSGNAMDLTAQLLW